MFNPKVSIIIPVYNGSNFLRESIESALNQTYNNIEIIVVNDGSNDNGETEKTALSFGEKIRYIYKENSGVSGALNLGIKEALGDYISWLSHDDLYSKNKISKSIDFLKLYNNNEKIIIFNDYELIDGNGKLIKKIKSPKNKSDIFINLISNKFVFNGCTLLIPKKAFLEVGFFNENLKTTGDYEMWNRMVKYGYKFINLPEILTQYRIHEKQDSINKKEIFNKEIKETQKYIMKLFSKEEIQENYGKGNKYIIFFKIKINHNKNNILGDLSILTQKLGIYKIIAPIYRKLFIK